MWSCGQATRGLCKGVPLPKCQLCQLSGPGESLPAVQHTCCGLTFWILLNCRGWSISISFVCSLAEGAGILKRGGLGLVPNLSAITSLNIFCGSVQDIWGKIMVKPNQRSIESISISMLNQFCSLSILVFLLSLRAANIAKVSDEPRLLLSSLGRLAVKMHWPNGWYLWLYLGATGAWEVRQLWDPGCFCASAYLSVYPRLCIGSSMKINLRMEIVWAEGGSITAFGYAEALPNEDPQHGTDVPTMWTCMVIVKLFTGNLS